ncbi:MAG: DUF1420 family protein [Desulfobaccales bacterium]
MPTFLKLEDLLAPPPLSALLAIFMVLGLNNLGSRITRQLPQASALPLRKAAAFVLASALVATTVYVLALFGAAYLWLLRVMAWLLAALGLTELLRFNGERVLQVIPRLRQRWQELPPWGKAAVPPLLIAGIGLLLTALSPPTDADSLDYHLGVPLDILRHHGFFFRPDWLTARLMGLGESLNLLGLAGGTDILGSTLQFSGLIAAIAGVMTLAKTDMDRILVAVAIIGCPVVMFLVPNQKPQMLPTAATTIALLLLAERFRAMDAKTLVVALSCVFFAISCKYSFILTGGVLVGLALLAAYRAHLLGLALGLCLAAYMVLVFPVHWHNLIFYGDPISPLLEKFKTVSNPAVLRLATQMRTYSEYTLFPFPLGMLLPGSVGTLSTVLGLGPLLLFTELKEARAHLIPRILLGCAAVVAGCIIVLCQRQARFFFEPYLWIVAAGAASAWTPGKSLLFKFMMVQLVLVALMALFGAATLFPGSLTSAGRDRVMSRAAFGYAETRWLNQILPPEAVVLSNVKSSALMPRPHLSANVFDFFDLGKPDELARLKAMAIAAEVNTLVTEVHPSPVLPSRLLPGLGEPLAGPKELHRGVRNPWNRGEAYQVMAFRFNPKLLPQ